MNTLIKTSFSRTFSRSAFILTLVAITCFALSPGAQAVSPPPDGGYPGHNTAEGDYALFSLTTGEQNTAIGEDTLFFNTTGYYNTATGAFALPFNDTGHRNTGVGD